MNEKDARLSKNRSRMAFDAQAKTYDTGMKGEHARRLYPYIVREVTRAVTDIAYPRLLDLGCGTGAACLHRLVTTHGRGRLCPPGKYL